MDVAAKDATDSAETVDVVDVTADAATTDVASAITAACGSSFFSVAAAVSATAVDAAMVADVAPTEHNISCIGLKRRSHFSVSFFIYIYNADPGRSHYGRKTFKTNDTI